MTQLELNLIGVPEVILDGQPVSFARRGSIALLAYLALSRRAYPRETLATLLAGDSSEDQARKYLSNVLVDLRQHLGDYVHATRQTVVFDRMLPCRIDVEEFHAQLTTALDNDAASADVQCAIELYRGEFLAGLALAGAPDFDVWLFAQREELRGRYMQALRSQVEASLRLGDWSAGIGPARRLIAEEPWLEDAHRQLMLMLAHSGQRQAAIAQYHTCRRVLREELDVEPTPETTALFKRMRAAVSPPPHNLPNASSPMVGRREEMRLVSALLTDSECQLVTITGMGGSGKTRLALEVARSFASPPASLAEQPFADGIVFVQLVDSAADAGDSAAHALYSAWARTLELECDASPFALRRALVDHFNTREMLIVLDNLENVRDAIGDLEMTLKQIPRVKVLATSRTPLHIDGERVLHVDGLGLPNNSDDIEYAEASALFMQEARRVQVGFTLPETQRQSLVKLCHQLGGFPLALLLAARWAPVLPCTDMVRELADGLDVLATREPDLPERHRSIRGILDTTLAQLSMEDRALAQELAEVSPETESKATAVTRSTTDLLPGLRVLSEQALITVDKTCGKPRPHPLLSYYVRGAKRRRLQPSRHT